ncbi:acetoacetate--CoA ligase [Ahrensia sp. R2A130]|uniref:acetoacetate--CoA ligase n=1 Tax=Ahrensia sp. R2A130 TaxID=744979 RepID=UPI00058C7041|nr:acetoacetate--CoA ligase [Ahrensia sp. R2A130]
MTSRIPLWTPSPDRIASARMTEFAAQNGFGADNYDAFHRWSVEKQEAFWSALWSYGAVIGDQGARVLENPDAMPGANYFPDAKISFAENLMRRTGPEPALIFRGEDKVAMTWSFDDLHEAVSKLQQMFHEMGIGKGDRIAAMMPNLPHTIACMLAANSIGAIWSSCSPDFGEQGVLDRFGQIEPSLFIACDGYWYNGKPIDVGAKVESVAVQLGCPVLLVPYLETGALPAGNIHAWPDVMEAHTAKQITFERLPFDHPLYILFSSGTTGIPKCIVHGQGGLLLQHIKEQALHCDMRRGDRVFYFTTCGWMMWNWLVSALAVEATVMLFDGSPFAPGPEVLFDFAEQEGITFFGTSAKFIDALRNHGLRSTDSHDLKSLRTLASTGSPLAPENFAYAYDAIKPEMHLASISGGTDIAACFVGGVPWKPVFDGEIQGPMLAMDTQVWDDDGQSVQGEKGELVCARPFPSMPVGFWNDPDGSKYHDAYFARFDNVWCHGDFAEWTSRGGMVIHGRSDATLNPGGVRIGTAEIYNQVERMVEIEEALCIGQQWQSDTRIVLFVRLTGGVNLTDELQAEIRSRIKIGASPRHVPAVIVPVADIPRTKSGKITELAVRDIVHGREVKNREALANPEALALFARIPALQT